MADVAGMESPSPRAADLAPPNPLAALLSTNLDLVALAFGVLTFFLAASAAPDQSCVPGHADEGGAVFDALAVLSPLALVVAAFAAVVCRRDIGSKVAAFVLYGGAAVPVFIGLAHAGAPCTPGL